MIVAFLIWCASSVGFGLVLAAWLSHNERQRGEGSINPPSEEAAPAKSVALHDHSDSRVAALHARKRFNPDEQSTGAEVHSPLRAKGGHAQVRIVGLGNSIEVVAQANRPREVWSAHASQENNL